MHTNEKLMVKIFGKAKVPKEMVLNVARSALQNESQYKAFSPEIQEQVMKVFDEEWAKVGELVGVSDVVAIPKRIAARLMEEGIGGEKKID